MSRRRNDEAPVNDKTAEKARTGLQKHPSRALIISALAAGGVFQLNGWQVQAHGNRSSHSAASVPSIAFTPDDYILMRQTFTAPNLAETRALTQLTQQLRALTASGASSANIQEVAAEKSALEESLRLRTSSSRSIAFLHAGDLPAAIAAIEGEGWTERVLGEYLWALLDVAYLGREGDLFTSEHMADFVALSQAAMTYSERALAALPPTQNKQSIAVRERVAEIYHNIASFTLPDDGGATSAGLAIGRQAANRALTLRQQLGQANEIAIAQGMVSRHASASSTTSSTNTSS